MTPKPGRSNPFAGRCKTQRWLLKRFWVVTAAIVITTHLSHQQTTHSLTMSSASQLRQLADTPIRDPISPEDLAAVLGSAPFISTPGAFNLRDMGLVPGSALRSGLVYRSAKLGPVQSEWIANKVGVVFDLRRPAERDKSPDPTVDGVPNVWNPPQAPYDAPNLAEFAIGDGSEAWGAQYLRVLKGYAVTFRQVLEHVRDRPGVPFLFHCTGEFERTQRA